MTIFYETSRDIDILRAMNPHFLSAYTNILREIHFYVLFRRRRFLSLSPNNYLHFQAPLLNSNTIGRMGYRIISLSLHPPRFKCPTMAMINIYRTRLRVISDVLSLSFTIHFTASYRPGAIGRSAPYCLHKDSCQTVTRQCALDHKSGILSERISISPHIMRSSYMK